MTAIELYKFVHDNELEYHWYDDDVLLFVPNDLLDKWNYLLGYNIKAEDGIKCIMKDGYFCFDMQYINDYFGIDSTEIFKQIEE